MPAKRWETPSPDETFHARIGSGSRAEAETVEVDVENERAAIFAAFGAITPFGHTLWNGDRFLGYFEAGNRRSGPWASGPGEPS
jgi:hypothetical protein